MEKNEKHHLFYEALDLYKRKEYKKSLLNLKKHIRMFPGHILSFYFMGKIYFDTRNYLRAFNYFKICIKRDDENPFFNLNFGKSLLVLNNNEESLPYLEHFSKHDSKGYLYVALAYYNIGDYGESIKCFLKCPEEIHESIKYRSSFSAALFNCANDFFGYGNIKKAEELYLRSVAIYDKSWTSYFQLGSIYILREEYKKAIVIYEKLFSRFPDNSSIKISLAFLYNKFSLDNKLEAIMKKMVAEEVNSAFSKGQFKHVLAYSLYKQGKYDEAIPLFLDLIRKKEYNEYTLFYLARSRYFTGDFKRSFKAFDMIFEITGSNIVINNTFVLFLIEQKFYDKAFAFLDVAISHGLYNDKSELYYFYCGVFLLRKNIFKRYYVKLASRFSNNVLFLEACARHFILMGNIDSAVETYKSLFNIIPDDQQTIVDLINLLLKKKLISLAVDYIGKLYNINTDNETVAFYYAFFLIKMSDYSRAKEVLKAVKGERNKATYLLADANFRTNNRKLGFKYLKISFLLNPIYLPTQFKSLSFFYKIGKYNQSLRFCKLMRVTNPDFKRVMIYEAMIYIRKDRYDLAALSLDEYLTKNKSKSNSYMKLLLAGCLYKDNKFKKARTLLRHLSDNSQPRAAELVLKALMYRQEYDLDNQRRIEKELSEKFFDTPSYLQYKNMFLVINKSKGFKRDDLGLRII